MVTKPHKNRYKKLVASLLVLGALFWGPLEVRAIATKAQSPQANSNQIAVEKETNPTVAEKLKQGTYFLLGIQKRITRSKIEQELLKTSIYKLEDMVTANEQAITSLKDQLANIDMLVANNERKSMAIRIYIAELSNQMLTLQSTLKQQQKEIETTKKEISKVLKNMYVQASLLYTHNSPEERLLSLLAYNGNLSQLDQKKQYTAYLNEATNQLITELENEDARMTSTHIQLQEKERIVLQLQDALTREALILNDIRTARERLLAETQGRQDRYEELLKTAQAQEVSVMAEVQQLKDNYSFFEEKIAAYKEGKTNELSLSALADITDELKYLRGKTPLSWPVSPSMGISAFYHDNEYRGAMKAEHQAVDIRALQRTKIRAPADGVVSKTVDNGYGYSYIIISHPGKIVTLYGHVSEIQVQEGQVVRQGEVIGLTGGMPGTKGAGWMTTGPHLHFEVFKDFKHVNPLGFLPLELLPRESLESKYIQNIFNN